VFAHLGLACLAFACRRLACLGHYVQVA